MLELTLEEKLRGSKSQSPNNGLKLDPFLGKNAHLDSVFAAERTYRPKRKFILA